jgi:DNA polymerase V
MNKVFALVDCNNFYVSCERLFRPDLQNKPVLVLSNNDGCVVSRSAEAKALGIEMAVPVFKIREQIKTHRITLFSSNFALYADISARIMQLLESMVPDIEIYSIDEAFLDLTEIPDARDFAHRLKQKIKMDIGIPVSIGIAPTKTLAKLANDAAKKNITADGVVALMSTAEQRDIMNQVKPNVIWGIGKRLNKRLAQWGIFSALQLAQSNHAWLRQHFSVCVAKTALELNGQSCLSLQENDNSTQQILHSRSFAQRIQQQTQMRQILSAFTAQAAEKLRAQNKQAKTICVFIRTSAFAHHSGYYAQHATGSLAIASSDTRTLAALAIKLLQRIWKDGPAYAKAGIILSDFSSNNLQQLSLFNDQLDSVPDNAQLMQVIDAINSQHRSSKHSKSIWFGSMRPQDSGKKQHTSPAYTTRWTDILQVT